MGHLWFLLALILIFLIACLIIRLLPHNKIVLLIAGIVFAVAGAAVFVVTTVANAFLFIFAGGPKILNDIFNYLSLISGLPALMCIGHDHLDFTGKTPKKLSKLSYLFYIVHFPVVVLSQYFLNLTGMDVLLNFFLTIVIAYLLTYFICVFIENVMRLSAADIRSRYEGLSVIKHSGMARELLLK